MDKRKKAWVENAPTEVLETIMGTLSEAEMEGPSYPHMPLRGIVHMSGVGQIEVKAIREELARRQAAVA